VTFRKPRRSRRKEFDAELTELLTAGPAPWHGTTEPLPAVSPAPARAAIEPGPSKIIIGVPVDSALCRCDKPACQVRIMIDLKVKAMERLGQGHRIDESEHARRRGDRLPPMSAIAQFRRESSALLRAGTGPR
jgi:hypothetical protein